MEATLRAMVVLGTLMLVSCAYATAATQSRNCFGIPKAIIEHEGIICDSFDPPPRPNKDNPEHLERCVRLCVGKPKNDLTAKPWTKLDEGAKCNGWNDSKSFTKYYDAPPGYTFSGPTTFEVFAGKVVTQTTVPGRGKPLRVTSSCQGQLGREKETAKYRVRSQLRWEPSIVLEPECRKRCSSYLEDGWIR